MKNLLSLTLGLLLLSTFACEKEDTSPQTNEALSDEEVVALVSGALKSTTDGMTAELSDAALTAEGIDQKDLSGMSCGETRDTSITTTLDNTYATGSYASTLSARLNCNENGIPQSLWYGRTSSGNYSASRMTSSDSAESSYTLTELLRGPHYIVNGSYVRSGMQTSLVREQRSFTTTLSFELTDLAINKGEYEIESGEGLLTLEATVNGEALASQSMNIFFNGDGQVTVVINGTPYVIDLN